LIIKRIRIARGLKQSLSVFLASGSPGVISMDIFTLQCIGEPRSTSLNPIQLNENRTNDGNGRLAAIAGIAHVLKGFPITISLNGQSFRLLHGSIIYSN
jgi:hypothetical protein